MAPKKNTGPDNKNSSRLRRPNYMRINYGN